MISFKIVLKTVLNTILILNN